MDGVAFVQRVRQNPSWSHVRFIIMTANPHDERLKNKDFAISGILPKPFTLEQLNDLLDG